MVSKDELLEDKSLDQQVHDAYDRVELSQEAQDRMLGQLLAAQREKGAGEESQDVDAREAAHLREDVRQEAPVAVPTREAKVVRMRWAPIAAAAAIVAALVVVGTGALSGANKASETATMAASESAPATDGAPSGVAQKSESAREVADASEMDVTFQDAATQNLADYCPLITLESGEKLTVYSDGQWLMEVDADQVGDLVGDAAATAADDQSETGPVACKVYHLVDDPQGYVVRYDGERSYWRCYPMK